jgi:small subunit ribosomal protein S18
VIPQFTNPIQAPFLQPPIGQGPNNIINLLRASEERKRRQEAQSPLRTSETADELQRYAKAADLSKQITRRWKAGDIYAPHDLSGVEMAKWKRRGQPIHDVFDVLDINPMDHYRVCIPFFPVRFLQVGANLINRTFRSCQNT